MSEQPQIRFDDGAAYETYMGIWSRKVGDEFLSWLGPKPGLSWLDVGCGNGAFTALLAERVKPSGVIGVDPSPAQLDYARSRPDARGARFQQGNALDLPVPENSADAAVMALVIAFVPDPAKGVSEMRRVVRPGGAVAAYMWDLPGGGFPFQLSHDVIEARGMPSTLPPSWEASALARLDELWRGAGLADVETRAITVERTFPDFNTLWAITLTGPRLAAMASQITPALKEEIHEELRGKLNAGDGKPVTLSARANAVKGRVPAHN